MKSKLSVTWCTSYHGHRTCTFTDWFDFADFVKQSNLHGLDVTIKSWEYVR